MSRVYQAIKVTYADGTVKSELLGYPTTNFAQAELICQNNLYYEQFNRGAVIEKSDLFVRFYDGAIMSLKVVEFEL